MEISILQCQKHSLHNIKLHIKQDIVKKAFPCNLSCGGIIYFFLSNMTIVSSFPIIIVIKQ